MNRVAVIGVPSSAGAHGIGQERAPQSFRRAGFIEQLHSAGLEVIDFGDLPEVSFRPDAQHPKQQNEHGLGFSETMGISKVFISSPKFAGLVITEFNPERDKDGTLAQRFVEGVVRTLEDGHTHW